MTRTWWQTILQRTDTDLLSYDFADSCVWWKSWFFRGIFGALVLGTLVFILV
jgi:hypothetical protein